MASERASLECSHESETENVAPSSFERQTVPSATARRPPDVMTRSAAENPDIPSDRQSHEPPPSMLLKIPDPSPEAKTRSSEPDSARMLTARSSRQISTRERTDTSSNTLSV